MMTQENHKRGAGRPRKAQSELKRQCSFYLSDEARSQLKEMALAQGCTTSECVSKLIANAYLSKGYLKGLSALSSEEQSALQGKRFAQQSKVRVRQQRADELNLKRRQGRFNGLTNVMVVVAPAAAYQDGLRLPGIYCDKLGNVWLVPYSSLLRVDALALLTYPCFASVSDYFAGRQIAPAQLSSFIEQHRGCALSSVAEKAALAQLAQACGVSLPELKESHRLKARSAQVCAQAQEQDPLLELVEWYH